MLGSLTALAYVAVNVRVVTETRALPTDMRSLTIDTGEVPVALSLVTDAEAAGPRIDLRMVTTADDTQLTVGSEGADSRVTLGDSSSGLLSFNRTGEIKVLLPPDVARGLKVAVTQRTGSLTTNADLDQLVARADDGAVTLGGSARRVDVSVGHGDISTSTRIAVAESFRASTEAGGISVEFRAAPRTTEAIADGDVTVGVPGPGPYRVRAQSGRPPGKRMVTVRETAEPSAPGVVAQSKIGNVLVAELR
jgi:hypothetical protein